MLSAKRPERKITAFIARSPTPHYAAYSPGTPVYREGEGKADSNRKVQFVPHSVHRLLRGRRKLERSTSQIYLLVA